MIQLKVYQSNDRLSSTAVYLELYDTEPIRLTLEITTSSFRMRMR